LSEGIHELQWVLGESAVSAIPAEKIFAVGGAFLKGRKLEKYFAPNRGLGSGPIRLSEGGTGRAFAGHGVEEGFNGGFGSVVVPEGTTIMIPGTRGVGLPDGLGRAIEAGNWDAIRANPLWAERMMGSSTALPGATVPNLILTPGGNLHMLQNSMRVGTDTFLSDLLKPGMGHLDWAACRQCF
jgi:hypothetical protein